MSAYTDADVRAAAEAIGGNRPPDVPGRWALDDARTALDAVVPAIVARAKAEALREFSDRTMRASEELRDAATCLSIALDADHRADEIERATP